MVPQDTYSTEIVACIPFLRTFARKLVRDHVLADDVVQDTLVRALAHRTQFEPGTNLRGWLTVILRNSYLNLLRKNSNRPEIILDIEAVCGGASGGQEEAMEWRDFLRAYRLLPSGQRRALALVGANQLSYEEAALAMGCQTGTMKSRVSRARQHLREMLSEKAGLSRVH